MDRYRSGGARPFYAKRPVYATAQNRSAALWLKNQDGEEIVLTAKEKAEELIFMALRTREGINRKAFRSLLGKEPEAFMHTGTLQDYQTDGFLICDQKGIRTTAKGLMILDALCRTLMT